MIVQTFVVKQLLSRLSGVLSIRRLDNGINRTTLLAESAVNTLRHVDIVTCCSSASILTLFRFDGNSLSRADLEFHKHRNIVTRTEKLTASQSLHAIQRSSPEGYLRRACSPLKRGEIGPYVHISVYSICHANLVCTFSNG